MLGDNDSQEPSRFDVTICVEVERYPERYSIGTRDHLHVAYHRGALQTTQNLISPVDGITPPDGWPILNFQQSSQTVCISFYSVSTKNLERTLSHHQVCVQQP